ncbi:GNAT family N-acetyltransferase [Neisseria zalophi]|uniref:Bifunctional acyl-CoA synthetase/GNAT family N-acetyltransferase n=1 Tax=Neisseria zalophi TaxID=640030 RepID=A0A5J6PWW7_9NEIS|nr:GNAT family N-acetyltransferase [Neisseria zalophi]QEY25240.1 bifunctional acyl-CoA synthetase/GNAT family N-acetyltransferase [Neisseria zalophi]
MNHQYQQPQPLPPFHHVIVVGASERPNSVGERVLTHLLAAPFTGKITLVNLRHKTVGGMKAYSNVGRVPEAADAVLVLTRPESYESVLRSCIKQNIGYVVFAQDWDSLSDEEYKQAQAVLKKNRKTDIRIVVCHAASVQIPAIRLNAGVYPDMPVGTVGLISGHAAESVDMLACLRQAGLGVSCHVGLKYALSPTVSADIIEMLGRDAGTSLIVAEYNPNENLRRLFSVVRKVARRKPVILSVSGYADAEERAVLQALSRYSGCVVAFSREEFLAAVHVAAAKKQAADTLKVVANIPCGRLKTQADELDIALQLPDETQRPPENTEGYIGSNPSPLRFRECVENSLHHHQTEALLTVVSPAADKAADIIRLLADIQKQSDKPLLVSSPLSDGLMQFKDTDQALSAFGFQKKYKALKQLRQHVAKPWPSDVESPSVKEIKQAAEDLPQLLKTLYLPENHNEVQPLCARLIFRRHPYYGAVVFACSAGKTMAVLPPFTTLDAEQLIDKVELKRHHKTVYQWLYSLNAVVGQVPEIRSIQMEVYPDGKTHTECEIAETDDADDSETVLAAYPVALTHTFTLKNGQKARIRPLLPEDAEAKQDFVRHLSKEDRYTRYMTHLNELSPTMLAQACNLDYASEAAIVAEAVEDGTWLGVARFGSTEDRERCEFGISVAEAAQGQGLAVYLMKQIVGLAKQQGYSVMSAEILKQNVAMQKLAEKLGFALTPSPHDKDLLEAVFSLIEDEEKPVNNIKQNLKQQILALKL